MFFLFSKNVKFILKSISYYFAFFSAISDKLLHKYLQFEHYYLFKNTDSIDFPLLKNTVINLHKNSFLTSLILNDFEYDELDFLKQVLSEGDIFFDIGANIGIYTLIASRYVGETGSVYSFEPSPGISRKLNMNIKKNNVLNVKTNMIAVSDGSNQQLSLFENVNGFDALNNLIKSTSDYDIITEVNTITLDDYILNEKIQADKIKFIKIDVEGWEIRVLHGAQSLLINKYPIAFMVEFSDVNLKNTNQMASSIYEFMLASNFEWYQFNSARKKLEFSPIKSYYESCNLIAVNNLFKKANLKFF